MLVAHMEENMSTKQIYNIGTTVHYAGDDINEGGYGKITDHLEDYLGELQLEITLEDGRVISNVTPSEFEVTIGAWEYCGRRVSPGGYLGK